jgi:hypothetical protein
MMKKILVFVLFAVLPVTLAACAPNSKVTLNKPDTEIQFTPPGINPELDKLCLSSTRLFPRLRSA